MSSLKNFLAKPHLYVLIVLIGSGLKFYKLDQQYFWDDEVATILHTSGTSMADYQDQIPVNKVLGKDYYLDLMALNDRGLPIGRQIKGLMMMPQLTPGHYYYLIFWIRLFGDGPLSYRFFSVFVFFLALPFLFLLVQKLGGSKQLAWIVLCLYAVSPFFQLYAQEARYYSLWAASMIIFHYVFLLASEKQKAGFWAIYVVLGFLFVHITILNFVILGFQGIYYLVYHRPQWKAFLLSATLVVLTALPWLIYIYVNREDIQTSLNWQKATIFGDHNLGKLLRGQADAIVKVFFWPRGFPPWLKIIGFWLVRLVVLTSLAWLFIRGRGKQRFFLLLFSLAGILVFLAIDLSRGSFTSMLNRYLLLNFLGFVLVLGWGFHALSRIQPVAYLVVFLSVVAGGIWSSIGMTQDYFLNKRPDARHLKADADELLSGDLPVLLLSDFSMTGQYQYTMFMSVLAASGNPDIDVVFLKPDYPDIKELSGDMPYEHVYALYMSSQLREYVQDSFPEEEMEVVRKRKIMGRNQVVYELPIK